MKEIIGESKTSLGTAENQARFAASGGSAPMMAREIHDANVLRRIAKEATWTGNHCANTNQWTAYRNLAQAALNLAWWIENSHPPRATCELCMKNLRLKKDGTFRFHSGCKGENHTPEQTRLLVSND